MDIDASMIGYVFLGLVGLFLLFQLLLGLKRGVKKSLFRLAWFAVVALVLFCVTPLISNWLNGFDISSFGLNIYGPVTKLSDIGKNLLAQFEVDANTYPAVASFVENAPMMILNILVFVLGFWAINILLYPMWAIIASRIFDKKKREERQYQKKVRELKKKGVPLSDDDTPLELVGEKKSRLGGALVGVFITILLVSVTFMPIVGINNVFQNVYANVTVEEDGEKVPYLSKVMDEKMLGYANSYQDSTANTILTYSGAGALANYLFNSMASINVAGEKITLAGEIDVGIKAYNKVLVAQGLVEDMSNLTASDIDEILGVANDLLDILAESKIMASLSNEVITIGMNKFALPMVHDDSFKVIVGETDITEDVVDFVETVADSNVDYAYLQKNLSDITDVASRLNAVKDDHDMSLLSGIISKNLADTDEILNFVADHIANPASFSQGLVNSLYDADLFADALKTFVNTGVKMLYTSVLELDADGFVAKGDVDSTQVKASLQVCLENIISFVKIYVNSENYNFGENTTNALVSVGKIVDALKESFLSTQSYNAIVDYLIDLVDDATADFANLHSVTSKLSTVKSWQTELGAISPLYKAINDIATDGEPLSTDDILVNNDRIFTLGGALKTVVSANLSKIVTNASLRDVFSALLTKLEEDAGSAELMEYINMPVGSSNVRDIILNNIWGQTLEGNWKSEIVDWDKEIRYTIQFIRDVDTTLAGFDIDSTTSEEIAKLGKDIDLALENTNMFISPEVMRAYINKLLEDQFGSSADSEIKTILDKEIDTGNHTTVKMAMLKNIYDETDTTKPKEERTSVTSWENEMALLYNMLTSHLDNTSNLAEIGSLLDSISESQIFSRPIVKKVVADYIRDTFDDITDADLQDLLGDAITLVCNNIENEEKTENGWPYVYAEEFGRLQDLIDTFNGTYNTDKEKYQAIGLEFDKLCGNVANVEGSNIVTKAVVTEMIANIIDKYVDDATSTATPTPNGKIDAVLSGILKDMKGDENANLNNITSYKDEFGALVDLMSISSNASSSLAEIGAKLDACSDSAILEGPIIVGTDETTTVKRVVGYFIDKELLGDANIPQYMRTAMNDIKNNVPSITSYETEFGYIDTLISDLHGVAAHWTTFGSLGTDLDTIVSSGSKLVTKTVVKDLILNFFDGQGDIQSANENATLQNIMTGVRAKLADSLDESSYVNGRYEAVLSELLSLGTNIEEVEEMLDKDATALTTEDWPSTIGSALDNFASMQYVCDGYIAKRFADEVVDAIESKFPEGASVYFDMATTEAIYRFDFYYVQNVDWDGTYNGTTYYVSFLTYLKSGLGAL